VDKKKERIYFDILNAYTIKVQRCLDLFFFKIFICVSLKNESHLGSGQHGCE